MSDYYHGWEPGPTVTVFLTGVRYCNPCRSRKFCTPPQLSPQVRGGSKKWEHLNESSPPLEIAVRSQESAARRKESEGRSQEPEAVFLEI
ncbi:hypothetical protein QUB49_14080 [Microcoleus sp. AT9_B4]